MVVMGIVAVVFLLKGRGGYSDYRAATYRLDGKEVAIGTDPMVQYFGNEAEGDLNGDGAADVAFLITYDGGGSGTFYYVVAAIKTNHGYQGTNAVLLGDRVAPQTTEIRDGVLTVNYAVRREGEPMTARPSVGTSLYLMLSDQQLVPVQPVACTLDAKLCPDGSYVGRIGPRCEFAPCPGE